MKDKQYDDKYCGVVVKHIVQAQPIINWVGFEYLVNWITERYKIHLNKDVYKLPAPWTHDPILQQYRFTNVRREHDRESKWLIKNISENPALSYRDKVLNTILFRLFNKHETTEIFGLIHFKDFDPEDYRAIIEGFQKNNPKYVFFTAAFYTSGVKRGILKYIDEPDTAMRVLKFVQYMAQDKFFTKMKVCENQKAVFKLLTEYNGLGDFLAYQIFVDFTYIKEFSFSENEFTVAGPGCRKGLKCIFDDMDILSYEEALFWLRDNFDELCKEEGLEWNPQELFIDLKPYDRCLNVMSLENCHCEISKYIRAIEGTGRPRIKYKQKKEE